MNILTEFLHSKIPRNHCIQTHLQDIKFMETEGKSQLDILKSNILFSNCYGKEYLKVIV